MGYKMFDVKHSPEAMTGDETKGLINGTQMGAGKTVNAFAITALVKLALRSPDRHFPERRCTLSCG